LTGSRDGVNVEFTKWLTWEAVRVTLTQLKVFLAVARSGSVKAAASSLGVTEPAISGAVAVLRKELGDPLFLRSGGGIELTPGGRRLAATAAEMLGLAAQTRRSVGESEPGQLTVAASPMVAEDIVPWLLDAFTARQPGLETGTLAVAPSAFVELLRDRRADVALGPRPPLGGTPPLASAPFLRFSLVVVASPERARHLRQPVPAGQLARQPWLVGPDGADRGTLTGDFLAALAVEPGRVSTYPSAATALQLVGEGEGLTLSFRHTVRAELQRGSLVTVEVATPTPSGLLYASTLGADRCSPAAAALCRFLATPTATQAVLLRSGGRPAKQFKPPVYVTLWS
jgi:DNA-binding transcriptional LysR family regulator